jgi:hypothetical protein
MKTIALVLVFASFLPLFGWAQTENSQAVDEQSLLISSTSVTGWFVGSSGGYSALNRKETWMPGLKGGIILDRNFYMGLNIKSLSLDETCLEFSNVLDEPYYLTGGYGGFYFETGTKLTKMVHITLPVTIGGGAVDCLSVNEYLETDNHEIDYRRKSLDNSAFFVIEPGINVELNVLRFMRFYAGYSYRWLGYLNLKNTDSDALNGSSFNVGLRFGKF